MVDYPARIATRTLEEVLNDPNRLATLRELRILDTTAEAAFDRLTQLASKVIDAPVSLVSLVENDRQFFKSFVGLPEPWASERQTPLSHSFCQYVVATGEPLIVEDARRDPVLKDNKAIPKLGVIGYLGFPLTFSNGATLGSFCVIDDQPRQWTAREIEIVRELAAFVMTEIELRAQIILREYAEQELQNQNRRLRRLTLFCESTLKHMETSLQHQGSLKEIEHYISSVWEEFKRLK